MSNTIGRNIKKYRKKKGYTQGMLSRKSGVYDGAISKYELGKTKPREDNLIKIADALEIPCNYLLEGVYDVVLKKPLSRDDSKDDINGETMEKSIEEIFIENRNRWYRYVARDRDGSLWMFHDRPLKLDGSWTDGWDDNICLDPVFSNIFPALSWDDEWPLDMEGGFKA